MTCAHCGRETPEGRCCTWCGQSLVAGNAPAKRTRYAASPNEAVLAPSLITTVFPHLGEGRVNEYRWVLGIGIAVLAGLWLAGLITSALIVAAILVPTVYVMYIYEVRVYRDAPIPVTLATIGGGFLVGVLATLGLDALSGSRTMGSFRDGIDLAALVVPAIIAPIVMEVVKPLPALLFRGRPDFAPTVDGLVFGIAAGLGYAAAETLVHFSAVISGLPAQSTPGLWILPLVTVGILSPLMHGSTAGLVTAALWRSGARGLNRLAVPAIVVAVGGHILFILGTRVLQVTVSALAAVVWQLAVVLVLAVGIRVVLDRVLRDEATEFGLRQLTCPSCNAEITAAGFCTACGVALSATPRAAGGAAPAAAGSSAGGSR